MGYRGTKVTGTDQSLHVGAGSDLGPLEEQELLVAESPTFARFFPFSWWVVSFAVYQSV